MKLGLNELKIGPRLALGYGVTVALLVLVVAVTIGRLEQVNRDNQRLLELQRRAALAEEWRAQVYLNDVRAQALAKSGGDKETLDFFAPQVALTAQRITALQRQLAGMVDSVKGKALIAEIDTRRRAYTDARAALLQLLRAGDAAGARRLLEERLQPLSVQYLADIEALAEFQQQRITDGAAVIAEDVRSAEWVAKSLATIAVTVAAFFAWRISNSVTLPVRRCIEVADRIAQGDLTQPISHSGHDEMNELLGSLRRMQGVLGGLVGGVRGSSDLIATVSTRIAAGNQDLSSRTEQTSGHLQQAADSLAQITTGMAQTAGSARTAAELAGNASAEARRGGSVVAQVVSTMGDIRESSHRIADIIGTIDGIAFQTNILALNAAVEAARAGPQGLGFAVVAGEVRSLAQRSAAAAREIKGLIGASVEKVESGAQLVQRAGSTMDDIVGSVQRVTEVIHQISTSTAEQTGGLRQINQAVAQLDQMTRQNASLVEEGSEASRRLAAQSGELAGVVCEFRVASG